MIWWIVAALCAYFVKGLCGFANTLVFTSILSFGNSNVNISPVELLLSYPGNLILAVKERKAIEWKICLPLSLLVIAGSIPGAFFLKNADTGIVKLIFGAVIIFIGIEMLLREFQTQKAEQSKILLVIIGILSGILCGLYGIGALLGAYLGRVTKDNSAFKANICVVFAVENTFRIILYGFWGILNLAILKQVLVFVPFMLAGLIAGIFSGKFLKEKFVKKLVIILLIISGIALILNR